MFSILISKNSSVYLGIFLTLSCIISLLLTPKQFFRLKSMPFSFWLYSVDEIADLRTTQSLKAPKVTCPQYFCEIVFLSRVFLPVFVNCRRRVAILVYISVSTNFFVPFYLTHQLFITYELCNIINKYICNYMYKFNVWCVNMCDIVYENVKTPCYPVFFT